MIGSFSKIVQNVHVKSTNFLILPKLHKHIFCLRITNYLNMEMAVASLSMFALYRVSLVLLALVGLTCILNLGPQVQMELLKKLQLLKEALVSILNRSYSRWVIQHRRKICPRCGGRPLLAPARTNQALCRCPVRSWRRRQR